LVLAPRGPPLNRERAVLAGLDRWDGLEGRGQLEPPAFLDDDVLDIGRIDRLDAALPKRLVHGPRGQGMRDVVEDLVAKALAHHLGRHLARPEAGDARRLAVVARDLVDLGVDDMAVDLDDEVFLGVGDVDKLCFHSSSGGISPLRSNSESRRFPRTPSLAPLAGAPRPAPFRSRLNTYVRFSW